jgi:hypothetical protein
MKNARGEVGAKHAITAFHTCCVRGLKKINLL